MPSTIVKHLDFVEPNITFTRVKTSKITLRRMSINQNLQEATSVQMLLLMVFRLYQQNDN